MGVLVMLQQETYPVSSWEESRLSQGRKIQFGEPEWQWFGAKTLPEGSVANWLWSFGILLNWDR